MGNALEKAMGYQKETPSYMRQLPKVPFNPKWKDEWLKVVVPGCKASRFAGLAHHPRIDREMDYSLEYFLIGLMLDRWPKPLPLLWTKRLDKIIDEKEKTDKPLVKSQSKTKIKNEIKDEGARKPTEFEKGIMDAYYDKRPSKAWLKATSLYLHSLSKDDTDFLKAWAAHFYHFVTGKPLNQGWLTANASTLLYFVKQLPSMKKNEAMMKRFETFMEKLDTLKEGAKTYKKMWESYETDRPFDYDTELAKHKDNSKALVDWINTHAKALRQKMKERMKALTAKAPPLDREIIVYRGISQAKTKDSNMRSFSLDFSVARGFGSTFSANEKNLAYLLRLTLPKGSRILFIPTTAPTADEMEAIIDMEQINPSHGLKNGPSTCLLPISGV